MEDLETKVLGWLRKQGYPLELRVAEECERHGFEVVPGLVFEDPELGKQREIDVFCLGGDFYGALRIALTIECKSGDKPWLLIGPRGPVVFNRLHGFSVLDRDLIRPLSGRLQPLLAQKCFPTTSGFTGRALVQAFSDREDQAFGAAMSALKASIWHAAGSTDGQGAAPLRCAFPMIVVDTPLLSCRLKEDGSPAVERIPSGWLYFSHRIGNSWGTCIQVVQLEALESALGEMKKLWKALEELLAPEIEAVKDRDGPRRSE